MGGRGALLAARRTLPHARDHPRRLRNPRARTHEGARAESGACSASDAHAPPRPRPCLLSPPSVSGRQLLELLWLDHNSISDEGLARLTSVLSQAAFTLRLSLPRPHTFRLPPLCASHCHHRVSPARRARSSRCSRTSTWKETRQVPRCAPRAYNTARNHVSDAALGLAGRASPPNAPRAKGQGLRGRLLIPARRPG